ncbi:MAG TPA: hypothetical protein VGI39_14450 [Polyangiaceae bacterium]|jgi:hypothetical protein
MTACSSASPPAPQTPRGSPTALTAVLATAACPELKGRLFSFAAEGDALDTYLWLKRCAARAERDDVAIRVDSYAWVAVDREFGVVGIRQFLHATVHAEVRFQPRATYADGRLNITLTPRAAPFVSVEPVGALDVAPLNWAALLAIDIAPAAGASPEALAKGKLREEVERALTSTLSGPLTVVYDARRGATSVESAPASGRTRRVRVAPRGTALLGPFPPSPAGSAALRIESGPGVFARAVCRTHAEGLLDADRRGDEIRTDDWSAAQGVWRHEFGAMPCSWMLALRAVDGVAVVDVEDSPAPAAPPALEAPDRWTSIDDVEVTGEPDPDVWITIESDRWRAPNLARKGDGFPALTVLAPDEQLWVRARRHDGGAVLAEAPLPLDARAAVDLMAPGGGRLAKVTAHIRVRPGYRDP